MKKPLFIKAAKLIHAGHPLDGQVVDVQLENGILTALGTALEPTAESQVFQGDSSLCISQGWRDLRATAGDPGQEHRETIQSLMAAAAAGGFTSVGLSPETSPPITTRSQVDYLRAQAANSPLQLRIGARMADNDGKMTEMADLRDGGASWFALAPRHRLPLGTISGLMQYAAGLGLPIHFPLYHASLDAQAWIAEGAASLLMGLKGRPAMAEKVQLTAMLELVRYTGAPVHFCGVSTSECVEILSSAIAEGLPVSGDAVIHNLSFSEDDLLSFDSSFKLSPPLRSIADRDALRQAVINGTLTIATDHTPWQIDQKNIEFGLAEYGAIGLQTAFPQLLHALGDDALPQIVAALTADAAPHNFDLGSPADFTLFSTSIPWSLNEHTNQSLSQNSPLWGRPLTGGAVAVVTRGTLISSPLQLS